MGREAAVRAADGRPGPDGGRGAAGPSEGATRGQVAPKHVTGIRATHALFMRATDRETYGAAGSRALCR